MPVTINGTTGVAGVNGSAGTPAIQGGDSNTGVFYPAADTVAIATNGTEAMRVDSSGNVGIGTSSPSYKLDVNGQIRGDFVIRATQGAVTSYLVGNSGGFGAVGTASNHPILFNTNDTERARIDTSGNLLVGKNSSGSATTNGFEIGASGYAIACRDTSAGYCLLVTNNNASGSGLVEFRRQSTVVGSISTNGTNTTYGTSSDYRLKEDVQPMAGALARVAALKPVTYKWKADRSDGEGFIAHELQEVCPSAVIGEKDAVNEDGSIKPQGIDTSFLVAALTAALQELNAKVQALEARLASDGFSNGGATQ